MTHAHGGPSPEAGPPSSSSTVTECRLDIPARADGVQLLGQTEGSGYREAPFLVRRGDGQTLQLTRLLYLVLDAADGTRNAEEIGQHASTASGRLVSGDNVRALITTQLQPLGLLRLADGSQPEVRKADPLLGMRFRYTVTDPERTRRLTAPFAILFKPLIVLAVLAAFVAACWWVLMVKGLGSATHEAFANPALLLLVLAVTVLSAGFHEFGHAAAARKGGATPGAMGAGLYLIWPAFFTDVSDSYRLGRGGRLRTDLGGLYFNAIVVVAIMAAWLATGFDALLLVVVTQILQMVRQLLPLVRFDGYHILADTTGVPDLFQRIRPTLLGLLPWHWGKPEAKVLKPWARAVVALWVLVTVPLLLISLILMVISLPRLLGTAWSSVLKQQAILSENLSSGDLAGAAIRTLAIIAVALPVAGMLYMLIRLLRQLTVGMWEKTRGRALQRSVAMAAVVAVFAGLAWAWWPDGGTYRPVQPYERGTLEDATASVFPPAQSVLREGQAGRTVAVWPAGTDLPTRDNPQLSMVLVPQPESAAGASPSPGTSPSWVFPFSQPDTPKPGDNQALAVNTTDGSVTYSVAFALVWAEDGATVDPKNEAYAFASCTGCAAVAVGFQVVLIVGQANVIVPENLSAAANYNCRDCLTYAVASQLVLTLDGPLSEDGKSRLNALWAEIATYGRNLQNVPLSEIQAKLTGYKERITALIQADSGASKSGTPGPAGKATTGPAPDSSPPAFPGSTAPGPAPGGTGGATSPATGQATQPAFGDPPPSSNPGGTAPAPPSTSPDATAPVTEPQPSIAPS